MANWSKELDVLCHAAEHPARTVEETMRRTQRSAVGCFPLYTPEEIVDACGLLPVGLWGGPQVPQHSEQYVQSFCCSIMKANLDLGLGGTYNGLKAVLIPAFCDTLKCICENWKAAIYQVPAIPLVYPQNRTSSGAAKYLVAEFERVKGQLEKIGGYAASQEDLETSFSKFERARAAQRQFCALASQRPDAVTARQRHLALKAAWFMDREEYAQQLERINQGLCEQPQHPDGKIRLVATGIMLEPLALLDTLEECGMCIAADDLAQESRQFACQVPETGGALEKMAYRYLSRTGDPLVYDSAKARGAHLIRLVQEHQADGVLVAMMKFCDPEEFDYPIYKKELEQAGIPLIYMETELSNCGMESFRTRLDGFREMALERRQEV